MDSSTWMRWIFWIFPVGVLADASGQPSPAALSCLVRPTDDGFEYQLSRPPLSPKCHQTWETEDKTMIAEDSVTLQTLVQNKTNQSIILKRCLDFVRYAESCTEKWMNTSCRVNCSLVVLNRHTPTVNETLICIGPSAALCVEPWTVGLIAAVVLVVVVVVVGIMVRFKMSIFKHCRRQTAYSKPEKVELQDFV